KLYTPSTGTAAPTNTGSGLITAANGTVKLYRAPGDPSNPSTGTKFTSYCTNGAVFGLQHGGTARFPAESNAKGTTTCLIVFERFASCQVGATGPLLNRNWDDTTTTTIEASSPAGGGGSQITYLYSPYSGGQAASRFDAGVGYS